MRDQRLHRIFEARAREHPDRVAICHLGRRWTYGELDRRAEELAGRLRRCGVGRETLVGICLGREPEMVAAILATLKAGGAYLPIDPELPAARIRLLLRESGAALVLSARSYRSALRECTDEGATPVVWLGAGTSAPDGGMATSATDGVIPRPEGSSRDLAYVLFTSGSTGVPKGVMVEHRSVVRLFDQTASWTHFGQADVWTLFHSFGFDFSVWELWGALLHGGRLVIVDDGVRRSPQGFRALLAAEGVTVLNLTPSAFRLLLAVDPGPPTPSLSELRMLVFGGERLEVEMLRSWIARHGDRQPRLINMFGITETTVHVTWRPIRRADLEAPHLSPVGEPIADLGVDLRDDRGRRVPDGAEGGLFVSGPGLARGYRNRPGQTAVRFLPHPDSTRPGSRMYDSGDRARHAGGELLYLGRSDAQLQVRGFRIEPEEIERCLARHPVVDVVLVARRDLGAGDHRLVAWYLTTESADGDIPIELERLARENLPAYLRPSAYHRLVELPLTPHGKLDRRRLEGLEIQRPGPLGEVANSTQKTILEITSEALQRPRLGIHDDFFDLGGTSLAFVRILAVVNQRFGLSLVGSELGESATVARLAACVDSELAALVRKGEHNAGFEPPVGVHDGSAGAGEFS